MLITFHSPLFTFLAMPLHQAIYQFLTNQVSSQTQEAWEAEMAYDANFRANIDTLKELFAQEGHKNEIADFLTKKNIASSSFIQTQVQPIIQYIAYDTFLLSHLDNSISEEEKNAFDAEKQTQSDLTAKANGFHQLSEQLISLGNQKRAHTIFNKVDFDSLIPTEEAPASIPLWKTTPFRFMAAAILVFGFGISFWRLQETPPEKNDLYFTQTYFDTPFEVSTHLGEVDEIQQAISLYNDKNYEGVIPLLSQKTHTNANTQLVLANSYMKLQQYEEALPLLLEAQKDPNYSADAKYYTALCYVFLHEPTKAKEILINISSQTTISNLEKQRVTQLLNDIQNVK